MIFFKLLDPNANSEDAKLANEYDKLAQMCLKEKKYVYIYIYIYPIYYLYSIIVNNENS